MDENIKKATDKVSAAFKMVIQPINDRFVLVARSIKVV